MQVTHTAQMNQAEIGDIVVVQFQLCKPSHPSQVLHSLIGNARAF